MLKKYFRSIPKIDRNSTQTQAINTIKYNNNVGSLHERAVRLIPNLILMQNGYTHTMLNTLIVKGIMKYLMHISEIITMLQW